MPVAFDAISNVAAGTGNLSWTHTPVGTPRGVKVDIVENGGTNGVSSVTYGGVAMELVAVNAKTSGEAGTVVTYFLGSGIPTGAQTVSVTVNDAVSKRATAVTVTAATNTCWISADISIGSDSVANPSSTLNLLGKSCFVSLAGHSGQGAVTGTTPSTGWTSRLEHDFGAQVACWYTYNTIASSNVACGWTQTADDAVMIAVAITEAPVSTDSIGTGLTESASVLVTFDARALPILLTEDASVTVALSAGDGTAIQTQETATISLSFGIIESLALQLSEVGAISLSPVEAVTVSDSCASQVSEETVNQVSSSLSDSLAIVVGDTRPTVSIDETLAAVSVADSVAIHFTDLISDLSVFIPGSVQNFVVSDTVTVKLNGEGAPPVAQSVSDTTAVGFIEPTEHAREYALSDSSTVTAADTADITAGLSSSFTSIDVAQVVLTDSASASTVIAVSDSIGVGAPEDVPEVATVISGSESLSLIAADTTAMYTYSSVADSLSVQAPSDIAQITGLMEIVVADVTTVQVLDDVAAHASAVMATDSLAVQLSDVLMNTASLTAIDTVHVVLTGTSFVFKSISIEDIIPAQVTDAASPIFDNFIDISVSDSCVVQAEDSITELVDFLRQLTASDSVASVASDNIAEQFAAAIASDQFVVSATGFADIWQSTSIADSLKVAAADVGFAIPRVTVNIETFTDDTLLGTTDGVASVSVVYEAIERTVSDSCVAQASDDSLLQIGRYCDEEILVAAGDLASDTAVANASPDTWNGNTGTEHRNDKPKPWKYIFSDKLNW